ncbi:hypothetical protein HMPREF9136_2733 [Prevotella dentalis DSM 3688]|uniref:DUF1018 domain-containing protein n=2 Tax=Prevotella dentalis (strain ATCC 49559 / DSM 3688 / JCM 13448 / NCTC 12043 / ES 2772) TaxID=908937 RepID=F9D7A5_PREDD|nr:hypothetical protein HMPREF9136_2733 [Prevotella dentalis DSM 3688]
MAETRTMDKIHRSILKKYHTLCSLLGLTKDEKDAILESYEVDSSCDLDTHDLIDICAKLSDQLERRQGKEPLDKMRKRAMGAIGGWLKAEGKYSNVSIIKGIACRSTGYDDFNKIPRERLRNLIYGFNKKVKDGIAVKELEANSDERQTSYEMLQPASDEQLN